jgi:predicted Zn-dependent protease
MLKTKVKILFSWLLIGSVVLLGCASTQQTQEKEKKYGGGFNLFSEKYEIEMGKGFAEEVENQQPILDDPVITSYVDSVGQKLAAVCKRPDIPYHFKVIDVKEVNAFALLGGYIFVNRGLIEVIDRESELAGVMAHEIGHVVGRHGTKQLSKRLLLAGIVIGASAIVSQKSEKWGEIVQIAGSMGMLMGMMKYSRDDENEADYLGVHNIYDAGYNPWGMADLFEKFQQIHQQEPNKLALLFSTHPPTSQRIFNVSKEVDKFNTEGKIFYDSPEFMKVKQRIAQLPAPPKGIVKKLVVPAAVDWVDTGIALKNGQKIAFRSEGQICIKDGSLDCCGPDGIPGKTSFWATMEYANLGALLGRIGEEGKPFVIGSQQGGTIQGGGELYLGINDSVHKDNKGYFNVTLEISIQ